MSLHRGTGDKQEKQESSCVPVTGGKVVAGRVADFRRRVESTVGSEALYMRNREIVRADEHSRTVKQSSD